MKNQKSQKLQSDQRTTKQVRIDAGLHKLLKIKAVESEMNIRELVEECLAELLGTNK
jgi:predicted HicB family RNase H-like nuclease